MDPDVRVTVTPAGSGWSCAVVIRDHGSETIHRVGVSRGDLERLAPGATDPTELVRASFAFLLEREPKESILRSFDLSVIARYFPEYDREIARRMRR